MTSSNRKNNYLVEIIVSDGPDEGKRFQCDIYDVLSAFNLTNVGQIQAAKKALRGGRSGKSWEEDMDQCIHSSQRALQIARARKPRSKQDGKAKRDV